MSDAKLVFPAWMTFNFGEKNVVKEECKTFSQTFPQVPDGKNHSLEYLIKIIQSEGESGRLK